MGFKIWRKRARSSTQQIESTPYAEGYLTNNLQLNVESLQGYYAYPDNLALKIRELRIHTLGVKAVIANVDSASDANKIEDHIVKPLLNTTVEPASNADLIRLLKDQVLTSLTVKPVTSFQDIIEETLNGNTALLLENCSQALIMDTTGFESRGISKPTVEQVIRGPKEAFVESADINRSLIRKYLKDLDLQTDEMKFGNNNNSKLYLMYMKSIANPAIVDRIRKRIEQVKSDHVNNVYILEQHIEERPYSLIPTVFVTERPDRVASFLKEGQVAIVMDSSASVLIAPVTFWTFFHAAEDHYQRWISGNFIRLMRLIAIFITMLVPGIYIAISTYHVEMLPTDLLLAIAAARERVPFPVVVEILFMELSFELIRESVVRVPSAVGSTIGIVGALVLGQAAVDANLVSPILVIIVAITGLSSYNIPDVSLNFGIRVQRFIFILFGFMIGFYGIALYLTYVVAYLVSVKSFGVPFFAPYAPHLSASHDTFFRSPSWKQRLIPASMRPKKHTKR